MTNNPFVTDEFQTWLTRAKGHGFTDVVSPEDRFTTELLSNTPWTNAGACGIYFWITKGGEAYVGQAVTVRNRLRQHWKNYRDIAYVAFRATPKNELDDTERDLIRKLEANYPLFNIKHAISSAKMVPFDRVVLRNVAAAFERGENISTSSEWLEWPLLEHKQRRKFETFKKQDVFHSSLSAFRTFIQRCVPDPPATEVSFWSVTIVSLPHIVFRVNVGQQEVFTFWIDEDDQILARTLARRKLSVDFDGPHWQTQSYANYVPLSQFERWLTGRKVLECRKLAVWLMRHTVPMNSGSHCPQFVRAAFGS